MLTSDSDRAQSPELSPQAPADARPVTGPGRRRLLQAIGAGLLGAGAQGCSVLAPPRAAADWPPVVFVHGNGDSAAVWQTTLWRFESNGWPAERLFAVDFPYPLARDDDARAQPARSSTDEQRVFLAEQVAQVIRRTGADKVVLVGNSRGGYAIRDYLRNGGGAARVSKVVLGGVPNHGVWASDERPGSEFNGKGPFLAALNAPQGPDRLEVTPGVSWLTLRSDHNDKFAQPDGRWIGRPGTATGVDADGPALRGAQNLVLPGVDHRETSFGAAAFDATWRFLTGSAPAHIEPVATPGVILDGRVTMLSGQTPTNLPLAGARIEIHPVSAATGERTGAVLLDRRIGADGYWGPLATRSDQPLEFVISGEGYATSHVYRAPFARSSRLVSFRGARMTPAERVPGAVVLFSRPRGYFDLQRNQLSLDGQPLPGVAAGVAGTALSRLVLADGPARTVLARCDRETIAVRTWPAQQGHLAIAELHY